MQQNGIAAGVHVITKNLGPTEGMGIISVHLEARQEGIAGIVSGHPLGQGPEPQIWWVWHPEYHNIGAYRTCELQKICNPMKEVKHPF